MAGWLRTVSTENNKYSVELWIDGAWQRVSNWFDTQDEATELAQGYVTVKAAKTAADIVRAAEAVVAAANDPLEKTELTLMEE